MLIQVELILYSLGYRGITVTGLTESLGALRIQLQGWLRWQIRRRLTARRVQRDAYLRE